MHVYTIDQILELRSLYPEPPYPGFSLEEACRRKKQTQTKLVRGPNAWAARGSAKTTAEWVERLVYGSLNKLSAANFNEIVSQLQTNTIFSSDEMLKKTVSIIFNKALGEPENSNVYAGLCYKLAEYEVSLNVVQKQKEGKRLSKLRNAVVGIAQTEFQNRRNVPSSEGLSEEEVEQQRSSFMRRKVANMRFIGELFLHKVLSHSTMMDIINIIMQPEKGGYPASEDLEFLTVLFTIVGKSLDSIAELRPKLDAYFKVLEGLKDQKIYPPRICFKMLDLIELRRDRNWESRETVMPKTSAATQKEPPRASDRAVRPSTTPNSSNASSSGSKKGKGAGPCDSALGQRAAASTVGKDAREGLKSRAWRDVVKSEIVACDDHEMTVTESVAFEERVRSLFQEWLSGYRTGCLPNWQEEFRDCGARPIPDMDLPTAVAAQVVREACMTTRKDAQCEASRLMVIGLFLEDDQVFNGFAAALSSAIEEGILEDVPKFSERFANMLRFTSGDDVKTDVYYDAVRVLCTAYGMLRDPDEMSLSTLMEFWGKIPPPEKKEDAIFSLPVVQSLVTMTKLGRAQITGHIISSLHANGLVDDATLHEWLGTPGGEVDAEVKDAFRKATVGKGTLT
ncbi:hypothetical protein, conserved [Trypanosoma brucei gambiense DAL972]|uniref:MIF4G domain-containing protein n=2 Tax=Trypanosoma brucei TaxID=5691 RepID=C9ZVT3_TRYB9|nr:hypothetical protein, conserved [Trypanosoma brucei gambiense DAL972]RHW70779.1 MIF4G domain containing protein [Trypanosoma brucei equiperdum]CBH13521.1 hypothetical protein, conserved [Trypanosoma brucei gambiense DAL972]|eukprot:XP_011775798.1 hypothetical protein, conserved [Trypanosoma brucei gambiense DAL972]